MTSAPPAVWARVEQILAAGRAVAVACTGGGSVAVSWLLNHPGASRSLVDARIPYHEGALAEELGDPGPHRATAETARRLAWRARARACRHRGGDDGVGLGVTAALATDRERRGDDRAFAAARGSGEYHTAHLRFDKGLGGGSPRGADRLAQEEILSTVLVDLLADACGCAPDVVELPAWAHVVRATLVVDPLVEDLLEARVQTVELGDGAAAPPASRQDRLFVPGSFNPLHAGHLGLAAAAEARSGRTADFELSVANVDKPPLPYADILARRAQDRAGRHLVLTREPTFLGKARLFPGCWFAIGYDTAVRLVSPAYYEGSGTAMEAALRELRALGCRFLVAGRSWEGTFRRLGDVDVPGAFADLLEEIPESEFRADVSSTALRQGG